MTYTTITNTDARQGPPEGTPPIHLIWTDPPYGTGKRMTGKTGSYKDELDTDPIIAGILAWMPSMHPTGTVVICCDYRLAAKATIAIENYGWVYKGEIIWEFGLGRPRTSWWPVRHNNILTFTRTPTSALGMFDPAAIPRVKRLAPGKGYPDTKPAGSVWDFTMSNTHPDRVGYPNQKPTEIIEPFILAHTKKGDLIADPFAGSGSTGAAALKHGRSVLLNDTNPEAITTMRSRLHNYPELEDY